MLAHFHHHFKGSSMDSSTDHIRLRTFVRERIEAQGLTMAEVSKSIGRNPTYIQQFVSKGVPKEFDEADRKLLAIILQVAPSKLMGPGRPRTSRTFDESINKRINELWPRHEGEFTELPVYHAVKEDSGVVVMSKRPKSKAVPPMGANAYCLYVADDSMAPEHCIGSLAIVDPDLEPRIGATCVFVAIGGHSEIKIRRIKGETADSWKVFAHNIAGRHKDETLPKARYNRPHVTCGNYFRTA
jgi:SOS-response transcriptional repressor LexA